jgi:hypothetical protein
MRGIIAVGGELLASKDRLSFTELVLFNTRDLRSKERFSCGELVQGNWNGKECGTKRPQTNGRSRHISVSMPGGTDVNHDKTQDSRCRGNRVAQALK